MLKSEPDKLAGGIGFGPRLLISEAALRATGLLQPGSLVRWHYRLRLPGADANDRAASAVVAASRDSNFPTPAGRCARAPTPRPRSSATSSASRSILTLVGLTALLVGGVGVANAVKHYLDRKREVIATLKSLGATGGRVFAIYLTAGDAARRGRHRDRARASARCCRSRSSAAFGSDHAAADRAGAASRANCAFAVLYGLLTALAFALWPLGRAHDVPVSALFSRRGRARAPLAAPALRRR